MTTSTVGVNYADEATKALSKIKGWRDSAGYKNEDCRKQIAERISVCLETAKKTKSGGNMSDTYLDLVKGFIANPNAKADDMGGAYEMVGGAVFGWVKARMKGEPAIGRGKNAAKENIAAIFAILDASDIPEDAMEKLNKYRPATKATELSRLKAEYARMKAELDALKKGV